MLQTEFEFTLTKGFVDKSGNLHREGVMRLATAFDEIQPMKDPRVQANPAYLAVILLARVVVKGRTEPTTIHELVAARDQATEEQKAYAAAPPPEGWDEPVVLTRK